MDAVKAMGEIVGQRIGGIFDRSFVFASFVPTFLFVAICAAIFTWTIGVTNTIAWIDRLSSISFSVLVFAIACMIILVAQVLAALRPAILLLWCGNYSLCPPQPLRSLLERSHDGRRERSLATIREHTPTAELPAKLRDRVFRIIEQEHSAGVEKPAATQQARKSLTDLGNHLLETTSAQETELGICGIETLYQDYSSKSFNTEWVALLQALDLKGSAASRQVNHARVTLDRAFGPDGTIQPTRLGNLLEAHQAYPHQRYEIEGSVFWPRLAFVVPPDTMARLEDRRSFLDFWLAIASLSIVGGLATLVFGPLIAPAPLTWLALATLAGVTSYLSYRLAVLAADGLGDQLAAACDMLRFDVAAGLRMPAAPTLKAEKENWRLRSQHALYGTTDDFEIDWAQNSSDCGKPRSATHPKLTSLC